MLVCIDLSLSRLYTVSFRLGDCSSNLTKSFLLISSMTEDLFAVTVAIRGIDKSADISPNKSPAWRLPRTLHSSSVIPVTSTSP